MPNVLVTGACGFIASNLVHYLLDKLAPSDRIVVIDKINYCSSRRNLPHIDGRRLALYECNVGEADTVFQILQKNEITDVFHLAAESHVDNSFNNSLNFTRDNVIGTHTLLEQCRRHGNINKFVLMSTDEVFGETKKSTTSDEELPFTEDSLLMPTNPYAATKAAAEFIAHSYVHSYRLPVVTIRSNNVIGPRCYPEKLVPRMIRLAQHNMPLTIQVPPAD